MVGSLFKDYRPLKFFSLVALLFFIAGAVLGIPVIREFVSTGAVPRLPTAVLAAALMFLCALSLTTGLILDAVAKSDRRQWELEVYRSFPCSHDSSAARPWWASEFQHRDSG